MTIKITSLLLSSFLLCSQVYAEPVIALKDGSQINDEMVGLTNNVREAQAQLMSNPQTMMELQEMIKDPEIAQLLSDPELIRIVTSNDVNAIAANPQAQALMNNPKMRSFVDKIRTTSVE